MIFTCAAHVKAGTFFNCPLEPLHSTGASDESPAGVWDPVFNSQIRYSQGTVYLRASSSVSPRPLYSSAFNMRRVLDDVRVRLGAGAPAGPAKTDPAGPGEYALLSAYRQNRDD